MQRGKACVFLGAERKLKAKTLKCYLRAGRSSDIIRGFPFFPKMKGDTHYGKSIIAGKVPNGCVLARAAPLLIYDCKFEAGLDAGQTVGLLFERCELFSIPKGKSLRSQVNVSRFTSSLESKV